MNVRLFIAVEITDETRKKLTEFQNNLKKACAGVKWVLPENIHITLKFIGYLDEEKIGNVVNIIKDSVIHIKPFNLNYTGAGVFPTPKNPRVIFAGIVDKDAILKKIHEHLNNQLMALGVERESRKYQVHLTVGRVKTRKNTEKLMEALNSYNEFKFSSEVVNQVILMKSDLSPNGAVYTKLHTINLSQ